MHKIAILHPLRRFPQISKRIKKIIGIKYISIRVFDHADHSAQNIIDTFSLFTGLVSDLFTRADLARNRDRIFGLNSRAVGQNYLNYTAGIVILDKSKSLVSRSLCYKLFTIGDQNLLHLRFCLPELPLN